jgi:hypothetical protein
VKYFFILPQCYLTKSTFICKVSTFLSALPEILGSTEMTSFERLRVAARIAVAAGAVGSVGLMLHAGRHNSSRLLLGIFTLWVLSPFAALVLADFFSRRWPLVARTALYSLTLVVVLGSLASYGYIAVGPPRAKVAPVFVVVPPASWLFVATGATISRRLSRPGH